MKSIKQPIFDLADPVMLQLAAVIAFIHSFNECNKHGVRHPLWHTGHHIYALAATRTGLGYLVLGGGMFRTALTNHDVLTGNKRTAMFAAARGHSTPSACPARGLLRVVREREHSLRCTFAAYMSASFVIPVKVSPANPVIPLENKCLKKTCTHWCAMRAHVCCRYDHE